jgi:hypothetical protein
LGGRGVLFRAGNGTIDGAAADFEWLARNVIGPEPTAAFPARPRFAFWDLVSLP